MTEERELEASAFAHTLYCEKLSLRAHTKELVQKIWELVGAIFCPVFCAAKSGFPDKLNLVFAPQKLCKS